MDTNEEIKSEQTNTEKPKQSFKCGQCGAKMEFKPGADAQECPYCGHQNPIPKSEEQIKELDFYASLSKLSESDREDTEECLTVKCPQCAAEMTSDPNITSQQCAFCDTPIVTTAISIKKIKPKSLLPFKITHKEGIGLFSSWVSGLWFAPNDLKRKARQDEKLAGMYVPYWTYDADTTSFYRGQRGEHYWETEHYTTTENGNTVQKTRRVRKTRWYSVSGTIWLSFDDVLVLASNSLPRKYTEKLEPWDLENLTPYKDEYLGGLRAESYQIELDNGFGRAQEIMDGPIRQHIRCDIGGDEQRITSVNTQYDNITFKHILLPIWISAYRYNQKVYRFLVNGRTGEVQGERPWSWIKITLTALAGAAVIAAIYFFTQR